MLSVLLKILAVLGIILLILLGLLLFLLLIVLFVPITYRIAGQIDERQKKASVKVNWFFGILRFTLEYSEKISWKLKLLWFDLTGKVSNEPAVSKESPKGFEGFIEEDTQNKSLAEKINDVLLKIRSIFAKIKDIWSNISYYLGILQEEDTKDLISHCAKVIGSILKSIRPGKIKINAVMGFESPDTTGKIYGLLCMLYPYYGDNIHITPDFQNKVLDGTLFIKGRIYICVLIWNALRILLDRKLFKVIHKLKNGGKHKNGR